MNLQPYIPPHLGSEPLPKKSGEEFAFKRFDETPQEDAPPDLPEVPTFSEEELEAARQAGYQKGFSEGEQEGKNIANGENERVNKQLLEVLEPLSTQMSGLLGEVASWKEARTKELPPIAHAIAKKVAGDALAENPLAAIEHAVAGCVQKILGEPVITVTVSSQIADGLEAKLAELFAKHKEPGDIIIQGSEQMGIADCKIEWNKGAMERNTAAIWEEIEQLIPALVAGSADAQSPAHAGVMSEESADEKLGGEDENDISPPQDDE